MVDKFPRMPYCHFINKLGGFTMVSCILQSPLGPMLAVEEDGFLTQLDFIKPGQVLPEKLGTSPLLDQVHQEVQEYFEGKRQAFTIPMKPHGTPFQRAVWDALVAIPYGQTATYGQLAHVVGRPKGPRAIGQANHNNPISILIPCHRCIGASGKLTGYGGGLERKEALLALERQSLL
jgi:methylated-DNA-[protein]-cysteine S-methyltransferase